MLRGGERRFDGDCEGERFEKVREEGRGEERQGREERGEEERG